MKIFGLEIRKSRDFKAVEERILKLEEEVRSVSLSDHDFWHFFDPLGKFSNVSSPEQAMRLAAAYRCISILSGTIASLPLLVERRKNGYFSADEGNDLFSLLRWKANDRQTAYTMKENAIIQMHTMGNAYILIRRDAWGEVSGLVLIPSMYVNHDVLTDLYTINDPFNGVFGSFSADEVIHLRNKSLDGGITGVSTIHYASRVLSVAQNADSQTLSGLKSGNKMKGFVTGGSAMSGLGAHADSEVDKVAERLNGELASDKPIMRLPGGVDFKQISISPADAQLLETRKFSVFEICRFFGVHPDKVFAEQSSNYKASENSQISFLTDTLFPELAKIEAEFVTKLFSTSLLPKYRIVFDLSALYQTDLKGKSEYYQRMLGNGAITPNEIRKREGYSPVEGGDDVFVSCNIAPINSAKIRGEKGIKGR